MPTLPVTVDQRLQPADETDVVDDRTEIADAGIAVADGTAIHLDHADFHQQLARCLPIVAGQEKPGVGQTDNESRTKTGFSCGKNPALSIMNRIAPSINHAARRVPIRPIRSSSCHRFVWTLPILPL